MIPADEFEICAMIVQSAGDDTPVRPAERRVAIVLCRPVIYGHPAGILAEQTDRPTASNRRREQPSDFCLNQEASSSPRLTPIGTGYIMAGTHQRRLDDQHLSTFRCQIDRDRLAR